MYASVITIIQSFTLNEIMSLFIALAILLSEIHLSSGYFQIYECFERLFILMLHLSLILQNVGFQLGEMHVSVFFCRRIQSPTPPSQLLLLSRLLMLCHTRQTDQSFLFFKKYKHLSQNFALTICYLSKKRTFV